MRIEGSALLGPDGELPGVAAVSGQTVQWLLDVPSQEWDRHLVALGGHPLQSAVWGDARTRAGDPRDLRVLGLREGRPVCMARVEERRIPGLGRVAWIPKGPTYDGPADARLHNALAAELRRQGYILMLETPYEFRSIAPGWRHASVPSVTLVVDLRQGSEALWAGLASKHRSQIRSAERKGLVVAETRDPVRVDQFYALCADVSAAKGFQLPGSKQLMRELISGDPHAQDSPVGARMLMACVGDQMLGGYIFIRAGSSTHTIWSAYDRTHGISGCSDLIVWTHIQQAIAAGCVRFDQEGIDKELNPSTYAFKKKFGGEENQVPGIHSYPLGIRGWLGLEAGRRLRRL